MTSSDGNLLHPSHRYIVDVGAPIYQQDALRFTDAMPKQYAKHPTLLVFGINNKPWERPVSYSDTVKQWLKINML